MNKMLTDAIGNLDEDIIAHYFKTKEALQKKQDKPRFIVYWQRWVPLVACFVLIFSGIFGVAIASIINNQGNGTTNTNTATNTNTNTSIDVEGVYGEINGLTVSYELYSAFSSAKDEDYFNIVVSSKITVSSDFVYNGKKFEEYRQEYLAQKEHKGKLEELLVDGELLKYGEALYNGGLPSGIKWSKNVYDKTVKYYGQDLLDKYIINGEFLKQKLQNDILSTEEKMQSTDKAMDEALLSYSLHFAEQNLQAFKELNEEATIKDGKIHLYITKKDFSELSIENKELYSFGLAS